jgi:hypothetical protein
MSDIGTLIMEKGGNLMRLKMKNLVALAIPVLAAAFLLSTQLPVCAQQAGKAPAAGQAGVQSYTAQLTTVNGNIPGNKAKGTAQFKMAGDELEITLTGEGLSPDMKILAHVHGLPGGKKASCATQGADTNKDGYVDVMESEIVTGPPLIPLDANPAKLDAKSKSYPKSDKQGMIQYTKKVKVSELMKNMKKKFQTTTLNLENMVVNLHGVSKDVKLPGTVKSEMKLPANQTIPVACGEIKKSQQ